MLPSEGYSFDICYRVEPNSWKWRQTDHFHLKWANTADLKSVQRVKTILFYFALRTGENMKEKKKGRYHWDSLLLLWSVFKAWPKTVCGLWSHFGAVLRHGETWRIQSPRLQVLSRRPLQPPVNIKMPLFGMVMVQSGRSNCWPTTCKELQQPKCYWRVWKPLPKRNLGRVDHDGK